MDLTIRTATLAEQLYAYEQSSRIAELFGSPGYLFGELDNTGSVFLNSWMRNVPSENTPEFKAELNTVLDMLRFDEQYGHAEEKGFILYPFQRKSTGKIMEQFIFQKKV